MDERNKVENENLKLSKFELEGFRSFQDKQTLEIAIPNGKTGSGITYLVGKNNSGKTSILEALKFRGDQSQENFLRSSDVINDNICFSCFDESNNLVQKLIPVRKGSFILKNDMDKGKDQKDLSRHLVFIPSRRYWNSSVLNFWSLEQMECNTYNSQLRQKTEQIDGSNFVASIFYAIEKNESIYDEFIKIIRKVFPNFESFTIVNEDKASVMYKIKENEILHRVDFLGDGVSSVMMIIAMLLTYKKRIIIIDEPELSLHPDAQRKFERVLAEFAKTMQIILATHSSYMVTWENFENGAKINKVAKEKDHVSRIYTLKEYEEYKSLLSGGGWKEPYLMDIVAREILFNENVLFTEGQHDVGLLRKSEVLEKNINLFGYGVMGFPNFEFALRLARDLGIEKAGVILDDGENERKAYKKLVGEFPSYLIIKWDREDIKDKDGIYGMLKNGEPDPSKRKDPKNGYFDKKGKLKPESELGDFREKIKSINDYF